MEVKKITIIRKILTISSLLPLSAFGQAEQADSVHSRELKTVVVTQKVAATSVGLLRDGSYRWDTELLDNLPKILGNADPVHYAQTLPEVQTSSELDAGLHIQGGDNTHNQFSIQGIPIYNAAHLIGLFSVFNASHYASMTLKKGANQASDPSRLGGTLTMDLAEVPSDTISGEVAVGLISSQATLRVPTSKRSSLTLSGRSSYLNLLYSRWLESDNMQMNYSFYDVNATWQWQKGKNNRVWADFYIGADHCITSQDEYEAKLKLNWGNHMAALHWEHNRESGLSIRQSLYNTRYHNNLRLTQADMSFRLPSDICDIGYKGLITWKGWKTGIELTWHNLLPQAPKADEVFNQTITPQPRYHTQEYTAFADYTFRLLNAIETTAGARMTVYRDNNGKEHVAVDPSLNLLYTKGEMQLTAYYTLRHQYLFQTGTTSLGMPTEFWTTTGGSCPPQWGHNVGLTATLYLGDGRYRISADVYYKRLYHQVEYDGDMMKFLNTDYHLEDNLLQGNGYNYGFSVMAAKRTGNLTGWISYAYGRARRIFDNPNYPGEYSASHERPHELNTLLTYKIGKQWTVAGTFVYASGTPFTAPESFYIMNGRLLTQYGPHNARRLRPYYRLDLSVNYLLPSRKLKENGLNLSIYNVTMHHNDISCRLKIHDGHFLYSHFALIKFMLPSISYFLKF